MATAEAGTGTSTDEAPEVRVYADCVFVVPTVAACVDLVVHVVLDGDGRRRVREVVAVPGTVAGEVVETADVFRTVDDRLVRGDGVPPHPERFARAGTDLRALLRGPV